MQQHEALREAENLRFRFQMNNRLRLESLAAVSKVFREFGEAISDDLLSSLVFALPNELIASNGLGYVLGNGNLHAGQYDNNPSGPSQPGPGGPPQPGPGGPPQPGPGGPPQPGPGGPPQPGPGGPPQPGPDKPPQPPKP